MDWMKQLDELKGSALKEMANVGISHVATAIGEISREKIDISLPELEAFSKEQLVHAAREDSGTVAAYLKVDGISDCTETLLLISKKDAFGLMDKFVNAENFKKVNTETLSLDEQKSIFAEVSTVIVATYFSAVESMFNLKTHYGVPTVSLGNGECSGFIDRTIQCSDGFSVKVSFSSQESKFFGSFLLIPDPHTVDTFFKMIGLS